MRGSECLTVRRAERVTDNLGVHLAGRLRIGVARGVAELTDGPMRLFAYRPMDHRRRGDQAGPHDLSGELDAAGRVRIGNAWIPVTDLTPGPAVGSPGKIVCVGLNYRDHVAEGGRAGPTRPLLFSKFANAVIADGQPIVRPEGTHALDLEVELGVVIGRRAHRVTQTAAMDHVAGYVVVNDVSARDWQGVPSALAPGEKGDGQWLRAKGSDTFLPVGPVFVSRDELDPAAGLRLRSWRITPDGTEHLMQEGSTADMIWDVPALIEYITAAITLEAGDLIATGTPSGVGVYRDPPVFLQVGDRVRCEIEGIGTVENPIVDWSDMTTSEG